MKMILIQIAFCTTHIITMAHAGEIASGGNSTTAKSSPNGVVNLGDCMPHEDSATKSEEVYAKKLAEKAGLSKEELLARLIYSESLSTGFWKGKCNANSDDDIMRSIGWGIMNRIKKKATTGLDAYSEVIFGKSQFRTSFSGKKENDFARAFLCPLNSNSYLQGATRSAFPKDLYKKAQKIASDIIIGYEAGGLPKEYTGITNFFYPQSEFFGDKRPAWAPNANPTLNAGYLNILKISARPCVEAYKLK